MTIMAMASNPIPLKDAAESHRAVLEALEAGDRDLSEHVLRHHVSDYLPGTVLLDGDRA
jgi:DNA-binding GntR family transcriptional regulator